MSDKGRPIDPDDPLAVLWRSHVDRVRLRGVDDELVTAVARELAADRADLRLPIDRVRIAAVLAAAERVLAPPPDTGAESEQQPCLKECAGSTRCAIASTPDGRCAHADTGAES